jgi:hypothetical protein
MNLDEIRQKFQSTIDEAIAAAKARLDPKVGANLSQFVREAARETEKLNNWVQERGIDEGVAAYRKLVPQLVGAAKTYSTFPDIDEKAWDLAMMRLGPNPPFYY